MVCASYISCCPLPQLSEAGVTHSALRLAIVVSTYMPCHTSALCMFHVQAHICSVNMNLNIENTLRYTSPHITLLSSRTFSLLGYSLSLHMCIAMLASGFQCWLSPQRSLCHCKVKFILSDLLQVYMSKAISYQLRLYMVQVAISPSLTVKFHLQ